MPESNPFRGVFVSSNKVYVVYMLYRQKVSLTTDKFFSKEISTGELRLAI